MILGTFNGWSVVSLPLTQMRSVDFTDHDIVAASTSPWTAQTQTYDWGQAFLSAMVTLATLTRSQAAAWTAALRSCRGRMNVFALGDPSLTGPLGAAGINLAPDGGFQMPLGLAWTPADVNWWIDIGTGYRRSNALRVASTDNGKIVGSTSMAVQVVAGQSYRLYAYLDGSQTTSGNVQLHVRNVGQTVDYLILSAAAGASGLYSGAFTVPAGITSIVLVCIADVLAITAGGSASWSGIQLMQGNPVVNGAAQSGFTLVTNGWPPSVANLLLPGDYFTMMSAGINSGDISIPRLYSATEAASSDSSGNATLNIWPPIREVPASGTQLLLVNTQGLFRRADNQQKWNVNYDKTSSLSFGVLEAL